jgi:predicted nuclease with TOPRIM domain
MSEPLDTPILINYDDQKKLNKAVTKFLSEEFTSSDKSLDENDDATNLIKEIQDEINLESKYKDNLNELKEKKEQDFIELEKRYNQLKEFKIHATNENISNKSNVNISNLGPPPKPADLSEFGLNEYDPNTWCCKY